MLGLPFRLLATCACQLARAATSPNELWVRQRSAADVVLRFWSFWKLQKGTPAKCSAFAAQPSAASSRGAPHRAVEQDFQHSAIIVKKLCEVTSRSTEILEIALLGKRRNKKTLGVGISLFLLRERRR